MRLRRFADDSGDIEPYHPRVTGIDARKPMTRLQEHIGVNRTRRWCCGAVVLVLSAWILHSFVEALLAACVTAIASWPLYQRFERRVPRRCGRSAPALLFT